MLNSIFSSVTSSISIGDILLSSFVSNLLSLNKIPLTISFTFPYNLNCYVYGEWNYFPSPISDIILHHHHAVVNTFSSFVLKNSL